MMNPDYYFAQLRDLLDEYKPSRERSLALTKLEECELWLTKCEPTDEAFSRDQASSDLDDLDSKIERAIETSRKARDE
jgi:hypothetical protein